MDIVVRLRDHMSDGVTSSDRFHLRNDAADEIERLRKDIDLLSKYCETGSRAIAIAGDMEQEIERLKLAIKDAEFGFQVAYDAIERKHIDEALLICGIRGARLNKVLNNEED